MDSGERRAHYRRRARLVDFVVTGWSEEGDGQSGLILTGGGYASLVAPVVELGAYNLDPADRAVMTKADGDALAANILAAVSTWASLHVQPGARAPPLDQTVQATGSDIVKAAP